MKPTLEQLEAHLTRDHGIGTRSQGATRYPAEPSKTHSYVHRHALGCDELDTHELTTTTRMVHA